MQSSARQRMKQLKRKWKPTSMEGSIPEDKKGWWVVEQWESRGTALCCQEPVSKLLHMESLAASLV